MYLQIWCKTLCFRNSCRNREGHRSTLKMLSSEIKGVVPYTHIQINIHTRNTKRRFSNKDVPIRRSMIKAAANKGNIFPNKFKSHLIFVVVKVAADALPTTILQIQATTVAPFEALAVPLPLPHGGSAGQRRFARGGYFRQICEVTGGGG